MGNQGFWATLRVVITIALRNLVSHRAKTLIVGSIMAFGTMLLVVGTGLLDSIEASMEKVVTSSLTGQLQVYSSDARDELSLFGGLTASLPDIGEIEDFSKVKEVIEPVDNVEAVVPMGIQIATGSSGSELDEALTNLREAVNTGDEAALDDLIDKIKQQAELMRDEYAYRARIASNQDKIAAEREVLDRVLSEEFWADFEATPRKKLLYLDTELAPLSTGGRRFFLRLLGTDPQLFKTSFDRFEIDKGQMIPPHKRGVLLSRRVHERFMKHRIARELDRIKREIEVEQRDLADDEALQARVRRMSRQYRRLLFQLEPDEVEVLTEELTAYIGPNDPEDPDRITAERAGSRAEIAELIRRFLLVDAETFPERRAWFYDHIAPKIELYRVNVGDVVALQSFTRSGYVKAVNVKVWGTFQFKGIEESDLAGVVNLTDMLTFRELYGKMTAEQREELADIREEVGVADVSRETAEDALFGGGADIMDEGVGEDLEVRSFDEFVDVEVMEVDQRKEMAGELTYEQEELESGLALNAAIILEDPDKIAETRAAINRAIDAAGVDLQVVDWQEAAGIVGQLIIVIRLVLYIAIAIIFLVALVIINNSMVMATMERVAEIGTMRAIGAQRGFVLALFMAETLTLGVVAGAIGAVLGIGAVEVAGVVGIPAYNEIVRFIFAGPYLYPHVSWWNVALAAGVIFGVSIVATLYPAVIATRIQPVVAMRGRD